MEINEINKTNTIHFSYTKDALPLRQRSEICWLQLNYRELHSIENEIIPLPHMVHMNQRAAFHMLK